MQLVRNMIIVNSQITRSIHESRETLDNDSPVQNNTYNNPSK